jgi:hypothetical protein
MKAMLLCRRVLLAAENAIVQAVKARINTGHCLIRMFVMFRSLHPVLVWLRFYLQSHALPQPQPAYWTRRCRP